MIEKERIEGIKQGVDILALFRSRGITLKKNGKGYKGLCPFHEDKTPSLSVNPETNLWQCFGCSAGGDVIRFVELVDKVDFKEALKRLSNNGFNVSTVKPQVRQPLNIKERKLLTRVADYYRHTFTEDSRGMNYLRDERGIAEIKAMEDFNAGYVNGTLLDILPDDEEVTNALKGIGILNHKGHETFYNCVVFPMYDSAGAVVNLYGRNINPDSEINHLFLPGPRTGLINRQAAKHSEAVILTESVIDALTLYSQGFRNTIPLYGVNGITGDHASLFNRPVKESYIVFDADDAGIRGADALAGQLKKKGITPYIITLPVKDVNLYFKTHAPEEFSTLLKQSNPTSNEQSKNVSNKSQSQYKETDHGFMVGYADRLYDIKGIQRTETSLKVTIKATKTQDPSKATGTEPFELSTIDLYSSRSRIFFAKLCSALFNTNEEITKEDLSKLLPLAENYRQKENKQSVEESTKEEKDEALSFLRNPDMFSEILTDFETIGVTGEETNKLTGYLAAVSRKLDEPLSILIQSRSAAGKSTLQDAILSLVPEEDYVKYTRITDQALFYKDEDSLIHKIIAIEEQGGMGGAAYSIRNIQSSKKITVAATGKDPATGKMRTEEYTVKGPVAVMITTTAPELEGETASRFLFLTIDESGKMTKAIHDRQRQAETIEGLIRKKRHDGIMKKHHTAQRLLKNLSVVNPYSPHLSYPDRSLRTRRDHKKYLGLIRSIAFLNQYQRKPLTVEVDGKPVEYIEVTLDDISQANRLANEVLGQSLDELAPPSRSLLQGIYEMVNAMASKEEIPIDRVFFTRRMIREYTGWSDWQVKTHISQLEEFEYLNVRMGSKGKEYCYALNCQGQAVPQGRCYLDLTPVEEIQRRMSEQRPDK